MEDVGHAAAIFQPAPAGHNAHAPQKVPGIVARHTDGVHVGLALDGLLQLQDGQVVLKVGRLVVLVDHHPLHLPPQGMGSQLVEMYEYIALVIAQ